MKHVSAVLIFISISSLIFSYTARMTLAISQSELKVQAVFSFTSNSEKITMPARARLTGINSEGDSGAVDYYQSGHTILIDKVQSAYGGKINITYTLPIAGQEFYSEDWLLRPDEKGTINTGLTLPEGFKALIMPYDGRDGDGLLINPDENPLFICGRYGETSQSAGGRTYDVFYHGKSMSSISDIDNIIGAYERLLFKLDQTNIIITNLPALPAMARFESNDIFLITGGSAPSEIKYAAVRLWFRGILKFEGSELFSYTDLYTRLIDDNGRIRDEQAYLVPVPSRSYYEDVLSGGFTTTGEIDCDVSGMLKNISMLHFAVFTAGIESFTNYVKTYVSGKKAAAAAATNSPSTMPDICAAAGAGEAVVAVARYFLPVCAKGFPDISIKHLTAYRNMDEIPDIYAIVNGEKVKIEWNGKRSWNFNASNTTITIDPDRVVPRLNFENDESVLDPHEAAERSVARDAAVKHKHYSGESSRDVLYLEKFEAPKSTPFKIAEGSSVYIAVVRIIAPVNGKLSEGLKEMIITVKGGKAFVVEDRIRL
ncbi:MAG: hypothetical protein ABSG94_10675 [Brevinematales bacterium]